MNLLLEERREPIISIITPTYNHEKYIGECVRSTIAQTYKDWEQIIIDDGSCDRTSAIIKKFSDPRIRYYKQENKGIHHLFETYNFGLKMARGKYIAILEGDDYWPKDKLQNQIKLFNDGNIGFTWGRVIWVKNDGTHILTAPESLEMVDGCSSFQLIEMLLSGNFIPAVTVMLKKDLLTSIGGFQQPFNLLMVDYPTWLACLSKSEFAVTGDILGYWRRHGTQMSTSRQLELQDLARDYAVCFYNNLPEKLKEKLSLDGQKIKNLWNLNLANSSFYDGRKCLMHKKWKLARVEFINAINKGGLVLKLKAILGILASYLRIDIEWIVALLGKDTIERDLTWID